MAERLKEEDINDFLLSLTDVTEQITYIELAALVERFSLLQHRKGHADIVDDERLSLSLTNAFKTAQATDLVWLKKIANGEPIPSHYNPTEIRLTLDCLKNQLVRIAGRIVMNGSSGPCLRSSINIARNSRQQSADYSTRKAYQTAFSKVTEETNAKEIIEWYLKYSQYFLTHTPKTSHVACLADIRLVNATTTVEQLKALSGRVTTFDELKAENFGLYTILLRLKKTVLDVSTTDDNLDWVEAAMQRHEQALPEIRLLSNSTQRGAEGILRAIEDLDELIAAEDDENRRAGLRAIQTRLDNLV